MRIRAIIGAAVAAIAGIAILIGAVALTDGARRLSRDTSARDLATAYGAVSALPLLVSDERAWLTRVLSGPAAEVAPNRQLLADTRSALDREVAALRDAAQAGAALPAPVREGLERLAQEIAAIRRDATAAEALAPEARRAAQPELSNRSLALQGTLTPMVNALEGLIAGADEALGNAAAIARLTLDLREAVSGFLVPIGPAIRAARAQRRGSAPRRRRARPLRRAQHRAGRAHGARAAAFAAGAGLSPHDGGRHRRADAGGRPRGGRWPRRAALS
ncbi:hypothetical protein [Roseomonas sp. CECT 9278]|uniref:hypothetical protein n=1 Tax=Roseomonas sp. CECT 9278 TaxID=2845823 RepID=UPI001E2ECA79|nr:hypothetical protein [Roseomonas sp. CECT 9278]CAH0269457.1 hypothetical protein ROS9278_03620 [Roseomonas sp. CECT 9278]